MEQDIVPSLLETIQTDFDLKTQNSVKLRSVLNLLRDKKATYLDVNDFAIEIGNILAEVLGTHVTMNVLPDGKMYFNIADRILNATMKNNHELISKLAGDVQTELNHVAGLRLKGQLPKLNQDRIDGIVNRLSGSESFNGLKWLLDDPIINFSQNIVDDSIKANVEFHARSGLQPKIERRVDGHKACKWCKELAGSYDYYQTPKDIYKRHERCRCTVDYNPQNGKRQDVWSKVWKDPLKDDKINFRKQINLPQPDIQLPRSVSAKFRDIFVKDGISVKVNPLDGNPNYIIKPGSKITNVESIAGHGNKREIDDIRRLIGKYKLSNGALTDVNDWNKMKGITELLDINTKATMGKYEVHWYQGKNIGKVEFKTKRKVNK